MANRFTLNYPQVDTGAYSRGLSGLGQSLMQVGQIAKQNRMESEQKRLLNEAATLYKTGTPEQIAEFSVKNPHIGQSLMQASGIRDKGLRDKYAMSLFQGIQNPELIPQLSNIYADSLEKMGYPQEMADAARETPNKYIQDPEGTINFMEKQLAFSAPDQWKEYQKSIGGGEVTKAQKTGAFLVRDKETGKTRIATGVFDPKKKTLETEFADLGDVELISKLGETPEEQRSRRVLETRQKEAGKGEEARASELISRGIAAAESTSTLRRALDLLDVVKTGGFRAGALRIKQTLGIEGADEGELSNNLGKAVLSQLRETFGAAFTQEEGKRLERIEGNFSKSVATNKRLLKQALGIAERTAKRAIRSAKARGDMDTVADINELLEFSLTDTDIQQQAPTGSGLENMTDADLLKGLMEAK